VTTTVAEAPVAGHARWRPILGAADRAAVLEVIEAIAHDLTTQPRGYRWGAGQDLVLADGEAGIAVFLAELPDHRAEAERRIARAVEGVSAGGMDASLHRGFSGIAWAWQRVHGPAHDDDPFEALDDALLDVLASSGAALAPGLLFGLAGIAIAALERRSPRADACLEAIVARLRAQAELVDHAARRASAEPTSPAPGRFASLADHERGLRWWLSPPPGTAYVERFPDGFYDLGIDVGAAGIVAACARVAARGVAVLRARELVSRATRWMISQDTPAGAPSKVDDRGERVHAFGWCKGELGMALAMLGAARATGERAYLDRAIELGRRAALVDPALVEEPGLHIGAAGALHAFDRLYQATGLPELRTAAVRWLVRLLSLRRADHGIGGFASSSGERREGLVQGAAGIGLALLALTTDRAPSWNRVLGGPD
jgi:hypothetical protein